MTSEVEERPRLITGSYGRHWSQWVKAHMATAEKQLSFHGKHYAKAPAAQYFLKICMDLKNLIP